jgi:hypothetical protein
MTFIITLLLSWHPQAPGLASFIPLCVNMIRVEIAKSIDFFRHGITRDAVVFTGPGP